MHQLLIIKTFEKVKDEEEKATGIIPSDTGAAKLFSDYIFENQKLSFGERRLADYYRMAKKPNSDKVIIKDPRVVQAMCHYLGYNNFSDFKKAHGILDINTNQGSLLIFFKKHRYLIIISITIIIIMLIIYSVNKQRWMVWENDRYIEVRFNPEKYNLNQLKLYNEERVKKFRKIDANCDTDFFDESGKVKIWYGKNSRKELEFFTSLGLHPETGKTLNPITHYMINKYICSQ